jgi:excisionase family DNA binding protein
MMTMQEELLTIAQVSTRLKISREQVDRFIKSGRLVAYDMGSGKQHHWRVAESDLRAFLNSRQSSTAEPVKDNSVQPIKISAFVEKVLRLRSAN